MKRSQFHIILLNDMLIFHGVLTNRSETVLTTKLQNENKHMAKSIIFNKR